MLEMFQRLVRPLIDRESRCAVGAHFTINV
jgi:hypothetical protein